MTERTNPYQSPDDRSLVADAAGVTPTPGVVLLTMTVVLLLAAVTLSVMQKKWEGEVAIGIATEIPAADLVASVDKAGATQIVAVSAALLALVTWGLAFCRRELSLVLHLSVPTLLMLILLMQLLMV